MPVPDSIEKLVRPFQAPDLFSRAKIPVVSENKLADPIVIVWGDVGEMPSPQSDFIGWTIEHKETLNEMDRKSDTIRIENPEDPSNYVMVKRAKEVNVAHKYPVQAPGPAKVTTISNAAFRKPDGTPTDTTQDYGGGSDIISTDATLILKNED
jgi:hypothetical protein